jgi:hypothetical protein
MVLLGIDMMNSTQNLRAVIYGNAEFLIMQFILPDRTYPVIKSFIKAIFKEESGMLLK